MSRLNRPSAATEAALRAVARGMSHSEAADYLKAQTAAQFEIAA